MNLRTEIGLGAIYMGTVIGAGFATGQEIMSFFTVYGKQGLLGIALASALFFLLGYLVLLQSIRKQSQCLRDILLPLAGERLTLAFELMADVFCLAGYCIMLSGCGAVLEESWNLNYTMTIFLLSVFLIWCLSRELQRPCSGQQTAAIRDPGPHNCHRICVHFGPAGYFGNEPPRRKRELADVLVTLCQL